MKHKHHRRNTDEYVNELKEIHDGMNEEKLMEGYYKPKHPIKDRLPHFIFSAENPRGPKKFDMSHDDVMEFLENRGYKVEEMEGMYEKPEKSILVHTPSKGAFRYLNQLAHDLGQESSISSVDGYNHEMHYHHHDELAGKHHKGQGTNIHKQKPEDFYSTTQDGTHFSHNFDFETAYRPEKSLTFKPEQMKKSELFYKPNKPVLMRKSEGYSKFSNPNTKLIHYSPTQDLKTIDPNFHGKRGRGEEVKSGIPDHKMAFFYLEGVKPEDIIAGGSKSKYVAEMGDKKVYDVGNDPEGLYSKLREKAMDRQTNPGIVHKEDYHQAIKDAGYHGIYNSSLDDTMKNVVGMFHPVDVLKEHPMHPEDFEKTTARDLHEKELNLDVAKDFAQENGHNDPEFLANLKHTMGKK